MAGKVKVSCEIAEEISIAKSQFLNPYDAVRHLSREKDFKLTEGDAVKAVNGYLNGYEIEETPEEKVKSEFDEIRKQYTKAWNSGDYIEITKCQAKYESIKFTLNTLGIKIKGINE